MTDTNESHASLNEELARLREGPDPDDFLTASHRLQELGSAAARHLVQVARDPSQHPGFRSRALETVVAIGPDNVAELCLSLASDLEFQVRWTAIVELGKCGGADAVPVLQNALASDDAEWTPQPGFTLRIRDAAAEALAAVRTRVDVGS